MQLFDPWPGPMDQARDRLARHLRGSGVELGPGQHPYHLPFPGVERRFVDKWLPEENRKLFDELGEGAAFPEPDVLCDFDVDRLAPLDDDSQDFVIASHVIEHLAEPLGFLEAIHRVLAPNATLLLLLPDRHRTFDRFRQPTTLEHLVAEYEAGVTSVDDDHLMEFLANAEHSSIDSMPTDPHERAAFLEWHRNRSIHVHCWDQYEFLQVLVHTVRNMGQRWEFVDGLVPEEEGEQAVEFGFVLRKVPATVGLSDHVLAERLFHAWGTWAHGRLQPFRALLEIEERLRLADKTEARLAEAEEQLHRHEAQLREYEKNLGRIRSLPGYGAYRKVRSWHQRFRG